MEGKISWVKDKSGSRPEFSQLLFGIFIKLPLQVVVWGLVRRELGQSIIKSLRSEFFCRLMPSWVGLTSYSFSKTL